MLFSTCGFYVCCFSFVYCVLCHAGKLSGVPNGYDGDEKIFKPDALNNQDDRETPLPPPPPPPKKIPDSREKPGPTVARAKEDDIFVGDGIDYAIPSKDMSQSPVSEDMEESPRNKERASYFSEPVYGPVPPSDPSHGWQQMVSLFASFVSLLLINDSSLLFCFFLGPNWNLLVFEIFFVFFSTEFLPLSLSFFLHFFGIF